MGTNRIRQRPDEVGLVGEDLIEHINTWRRNTGARPDQYAWLCFPARRPRLISAGRRKRESGQTRCRQKGFDVRFHVSPHRMNAKPPQAVVFLLIASSTEVSE